MSSEKSPLLNDQNDYNALKYGQSSETPEADRQSTFVTDEPPPPYSLSPHGTPLIACKVCGFMIDITGRREQHVVKCSSCKEATPIKSAPPGKKYVRCPCNCLLICKSSSQKIACPRNNCKRVINLTPVPTANMPTVPGMCQVCCAYCYSIFLFNSLSNGLARCPHCRKVSSVGQQFSRSRATLFMIIGFLMLFTGIGITVGTFRYAAMHGGIYCVYIGCFIISILLFFKSIYYFTMRASSIEGPI